MTHRQFRSNEPVKSKRMKVGAQRLRQGVKVGQEGPSLLSH